MKVGLWPLEESRPFLIGLLKEKRNEVEDCFEDNPTLSMQFAEEGLQENHKNHLLLFKN